MKSSQNTLLEMCNPTEFTNYRYFYVINAGLKQLGTG